MRIISHRSVFLKIDLLRVKLVEGCLRIKMVDQFLPNVPITSIFYTSNFSDFIAYIRTLTPASALFNRRGPPFRVLQGPRWCHSFLHEPIITIFRLFGNCLFRRFVQTLTKFVAERLVSLHFPTIPLHQPSHPPSTPSCLQKLRLTNYLQQP